MGRQGNVACVLVLAAGLLLTSMSTWAEPEPAPEPESDSATEESPEAAYQPEFVANFHGALSHGISSTVEWLDGFFIEDRSDMETNRSHVLLRGDGLVRKGARPAWSSDLRARTRLPTLERQLERRLELVVAGAGGDDEAAEEERERVPTGDEDELGVTDIALQYVLDISDNLNLRYESGTRVSIRRAILFGGVRYQQNLPFPEPWAGRLAERLRWYSDSGWESRGMARLDRALGPRFLGRIEVTADSEEPWESWSWSAGPQLFQELSSRRVVRYEARGSWQSDLEPQFRQGILRLRYRQRILGDWLYAEVAPALVWPAESDYTMTPELRLRLDAYFSRHHAGGT